MKSRRFFPILILALAAVTLPVSCSEDDDDDTKEYLSGSLSFKIPSYMERGESKSFQLDTMAFLTRSDGGAVGYYWTDTESVRDTILFLDGTTGTGHSGKTFTVTVPSDLGSYSMSLSGYGDSEIYYITTKTVSFVVVDDSLDGDGSITGFRIGLPGESFTDPRDGREYWFATVGNTEWMRQNLAWTGAGSDFALCPAMNGIFGRYYTWEEAQTACPEGWELPTDSDWVELAENFGGLLDECTGTVSGVAGSLMGDFSFNDEKMWEYWTEVEITNSSGLSCIPTGYATIEDGECIFPDSSSYCVLWTSSEQEGLGIYRYIYETRNDLCEGLGSKTDFAAPLRCIRRK